MKRQEKETFGSYLKELRIEAGYGLRRFASLIEIPAPNLCDMEHDRRAMPNEKALAAAEALGLERDSAQWQKFFELAQRSSEVLPADVRHVAQRRLIPALLRTIDNRQLTDAEIAQLIDDINKRET